MPTDKKISSIYEILPTKVTEILGAIKQREQEEKWRKAEERLILTERAFERVGFAGYAVLSMVIRPLRDRYKAGERSQVLYEEIMEVTL